MRKRGKRTQKRHSRGEWSVLIGALLFLLLCFSIYLQKQTGILGSWIGNFFFSLFGVYAYSLPLFFMIYALCISTGHWKDRLRKNILYVTVLVFFIAMLTALYQVDSGELSSRMTFAKERGLLHQGAGMIPMLTGGLLSMLVGRIGVLIITVVIGFFFILHLFQISAATVWAHFSQGIIHILHAGTERGKAYHLARKEERAQRRAEQEEKEKLPSARASLPRSNKKKNNRLIDEGIASEEKSIPIRDYTQQNTQDMLQRSQLYSDAFSVEELPARQEEEIAENISFAEAVQPIEEIQEETPEPISSSDPSYNTENLAEPFDFTKKAPISLEASSTSSASAESSADAENAAISTAETSEEKPPYVHPPIGLLRLMEKTKGTNTDSLRADATRIEETLHSFGIDGNVVGIQRGPSVTRFELKPPVGVKVSRIVNLSDDLALALAAEDIRIEAPIPGKPYVGIEVPNRKKDPVLFREILESTEFSQLDSLPVALGQSIDGLPIIAHLAKMPHLLIAGATGSGKSVCINTIILSLIYRYTPDEVKMLLVDPKVVELSVYGKIPHLLLPVVTDPKKASQALYMGVQEMERRFKLFSKHSVRDIAGYRAKQAQDETMEILPYLVIIIDELSDLMMVASKDVEGHITRLAQMARACGIHLIIATQRPSVDVITGTIKANIPSRISFQVSSAIDSRTILDMSGAEKLLGKGDMLYYPASFPKPKRIQGAFVSDEEVTRVVSFLEERTQVEYDRAMMETLQQPTEERNLQEEESDALLEEVLEFISHEETTSISGLQRRFRIGYSRAGRLIDTLEAMGAVGPQDGSKPRAVYIKPGEWGKQHESTE